tara:strand:- start:957 stop:1100 length:144 start_codon:yes stop_codon:yes gene_type:complete
MFYVDVAIILPREFIQKIILSLSQNPVAAILGPRQIGKTTNKNPHMS